MGRPRREPCEQHVEIERDGKRYTGEYVVTGGMVRVTSEYGWKETHVGSVPAQELAKALLGEVVDEWRRTGKTVRGPATNLLQGSEVVEREVPLVRFLAERVIIASGSPIG